MPGDPTPAGAAAAAAGPRSPARRAADRYVAAVNAHDLAAMGALFAPGATLHHPMGIFEGRKAVLGFYEDVVFAFMTVLTAVSVVDGGDACVLECEGRSPEGTAADVQRACDVFRVDATGAVIDLAIYYR